MIAVLVGVAVAIVHYGLLYVASGGVSSYFHLPGVISFDLVHGLILAPFMEELLHRGALLWALDEVGYWKARGWIRSKRLTLTLVFLIQAISFGLLHWWAYPYWEMVVSSTIFGLVAGALVWRFRTLKTAMAYHAVWNLLATIL